MSRLAIVSGGTYGAGRAIVSQLLADGFSVATFSNDPAQVKAAADEWAGRDDVTVDEVDVRDASGVDEFVARATGRFGKVFALVNNAAVRPTGTVLDTTEETWDTTLDINLKGQFLLSKAALPSMIEAGEGSIVNMASVSAYGGGAHAAYIASWLELLKEDSRAIFTASSKAQQAADWMHARQAQIREAA